MISPLRVEWRDDEESRTVWVFGEIDIATCHELGEALDSDKQRLLVDMSGVTFIDLSGVRCLVNAAHQYEKVRLIPSPRVERLLELTATTHLFELG